MRILKKDDRSVSNSKTFVKAVEELAKDAAATLRIYEKSGLKGRYLAEIPIAEAVELARNFEESLKDEFGGGEYQVTFCNADSEVKAKYSFEIAGPPKGRDAAEDESFRGSRAATSDRQMLTEVMGKLADAAISNKAGAGEDFQKTLELARTLKGDDSLTPKDLIELAQAFQGQSGGGSDIIAAFMDGFHVRGEVQPQIEREDSTTQILQAIMPLIAGFIGRKQGIAPGAVDPALLQQVEQAVTARLQGVPSPASMTGSPRPPGATDSPTASVPDSGVGLGGPADDLADSPDAPGPPAQAGTEEYFMERFVNPFREDVAAGQPEDELAYQIVAMITYARDRMPDNPPALVVDFLTADGLAEYDAALSKFFAALPELANLRQKCEAIRNALIQRFMRPASAPEDIQNEIDSIIIENAESAPEAEHADQLDSSQVEHETVSSEI